MRPRLRLIGTIALGAAALVSAAMITGEAPARGANGLDERAGATAGVCRTLAETWREAGGVPDQVEIAGRSRPVLDLSSRGVVPGVDIQHALQAAFDAAAAMPEPILFLPPTPAGERYLRSGRVTLAAAGAELCGYGARLVGVDAADLGFGVEADGIGLYGLTLEAPPDAFSDWAERWRGSSGAGPPRKFLSSGRRFGLWASHVILFDARDVILRDMTLLGARRGGMRLYSVSNVLIEGACVYRPHSDGIHIVNGSEHVTVRGSRVIESGDDCISVVTYDRDEQPRTVSDVLIEGNVCAGSRTRGLTVIGGDDVDIIGNEVRDTLMAGILLYPSPSHNTYPVRNVTVAGNRLDGAGLRRDRCNNCGDVVVNDPGGMIENVTIGENDIVRRPTGSPVRTGASCAPAGR
ncbi:right-handed parallel beta-helix repeat-containing protein [Pikeienuella sp. HZG-20]|uniref:right-handed parallel beta-helix repeat-containing protein n=1 Tax=Paludibacillus litoralis TaxID=3133267 RepID=UPI0030EB44E9